MTNPNPDKRSRRIEPEQYARLKAEMTAPYRGLRQFVYVVCGASGLIGAFVFLANLAAGGEVASVLPNLGLQVGVVALMVWLFRLEQKAARRKEGRRNAGTQGNEESSGF